MSDYRAGLEAAAKEETVIGNAEKYTPLTLKPDAPKAGTPSSDDKLLREQVEGLLVEPLALIKQVLVKFETAAVEEWKKAVRARVRENQQLEARRAEAVERAEQAESALAAAKAEGLVRDAERYHYIQGIAYIGVTRHNECLWSLRGLYEKEGHTLDATIDEAMKGAEQ